MDFFAEVFCGGTPNDINYFFFFAGCLRVKALTFPYSDILLCIYDRHCRTKESYLAVNYRDVLDRYFPSSFVELNRRHEVSLSFFDSTESLVVLLNELDHGDGRWVRFSECNIMSDICFRNGGEGKNEKNAGAEQ